MEYIPIDTEIESNLEKYEQEKQLLQQQLVNQMTRRDMTPTRMTGNNGNESLRAPLSPMSFKRPSVHNSRPSTPSRKTTIIPEEREVQLQELMSVKKELQKQLETLQSSDPNEDNANKRAEDSHSIALISRFDAVDNSKRSRSVTSVSSRSSSAGRAMSSSSSTSSQRRRTSNLLVPPSQPTRFMKGNNQNSYSDKLPHPPQYPATVMNNTTKSKMLQKMNSKN